MCTAKWEPSRISWEIWYSCYHFQVSLPDHGESTVSTMKAMYSIMEPDLSCFNLWQVCFLSLYLHVNMNAPSIITRYHQHKLIFSFLAFYLYESEVGWAPHERRYWSRCHKRINRFCSSFSCYKRKASWFVQTILHAFLRISLLFSSLGHTRFSFFFLLIHWWLIWQVFFNWPVAPMLTQLMGWGKSDFFKRHPLQVTFSHFLGSSTHSSPLVLYSSYLPNFW